MTADELRTFRLKKGFSQEAFAPLVGVTTNTVARWEQGKRRIPHWLPDKIAANPILSPSKKK